MLLENATSKEQVQAALDNDDEELREDIEEKLDEARRWWTRRGYEYIGNDDQGPDFRDIIENSKFVDEVIKDSPSEYDLANIPREEVEKDLRWAATHPASGRRQRKTWGPFYLDDGGNHFSFEVHTSVSAQFPDNQLPTNAEYIPEDLAEEFWDSLDFSVEWDQKKVVEENYGSTEGESVYVVANEEEFVEWCRDLVSTYMDTLIKSDEDGAIKLFMTGLAYENRSLAAKMQSADLPKEEVLDFASKWFESEREREGVVATLVDYFKSMETGVEEPREILGEWTQADLRAMGISKGPLFEEAPWKLLKLHPADLRLEGTLMRHCVGEKGMGYIKALSDGQIEIWSLRSQKNKPRFTLEVDTQFYADDIRRTMDDQTPGLSEAELRAENIKQLKGKANRSPGFADKHETDGIRFPEEVVFWEHVLPGLGVDPASVADFRGSLLATYRIGQPGGSYPTLEEYRLREYPGDHPRRHPVLPNRGEVCTGFDLPYRPITVRPNRRTSKRRTSRRRA
jgi:hypothetical protein